MIVTRFAPSPTGYLHLGHAHAALIAARAARLDGRFLLRIEDIDPSRCRPVFADAILEDLAWLGLVWPQPVRRQSEHMRHYADCLDELKQRDLLYPCFCTRADIAQSANAPHDPDGAPLYPGTCRTLDPVERADRLARGDRHAWRLDNARAQRRVGSTHTNPTHGAPPLQIRPERFGDVVLARRDVPASYHLCATHDDAAQGVTLVTRGEDLRPATDIHRLLQALLGWPTPDYRFHALLTGPDGKRLSKRDGAYSLRQMREAGMTPDELRRRLDQA